MFTKKTKNIILIFILFYLLKFFIHSKLSKIYKDKYQDNCNEKNLNIISIIYFANVIFVTLMLYYKDLFIYYKDVFNGFILGNCALMLGINIWHGVELFTKKNCFLYDNGKLSSLGSLRILNFVFHLLYLIFYITSVVLLYVKSYKK